MKQPYRPQYKAIAETVQRDDAPPAVPVGEGVPHSPGRSPRIPIALKLALAFILLIASGMITLGFLAGKSQTELLESQMDKFGSTLIAQMAEQAREPLLAGDLLNLELIVNNLIQDSNIEGAAIYSEHRQPMVQTGAIPTVSTLLSIHSKGDRSAQFTRPAGAPGLEDGRLIAYVAPVVFRDITVGHVLLSFDYSLIRKAKQETIVTVAGTIALMLLLAIAVSIYLGSRFTRPIRELVMACEAFAKGNFDYRIQATRNDELGDLMGSLNLMGEGLQRKEQVEKVFSCYVSPQVARRALAVLNARQSLKLGGQHVEASVLFADIVGFTSLSEKLAPQEVSTLLNQYFSNIAHAVHFCHGHIDKYMGDCAMIVFGVPDADEEHSFNALACAWMILELVRQMNRRQLANRKLPVEFRIGVNSGLMLAGNMGSLERMEYTVVGDAVNLASRLSHAGEPGQVILTEDMLGRPGLSERIHAVHHGRIKLRGKSAPVSIFNLGDIRDPLRARMLDEIRRILANEETHVA